MFTIDSYRFAFLCYPNSYPQRYARLDRLLNNCVCECRPSKTCTEVQGSSRDWSKFTGIYRRIARFQMQKSYPVRASLPYKMGALVELALNYVIVSIVEPQVRSKLQDEASASMLMASVVSTALLNEVRASASVGDGGRGR
jgi:hypothetical protein